MDPITVTYYAVVCGLLAALVPPSLRMVFRLGIGAGVGVVAAVVLPFIQGLFAGGY